MANVITRTVCTFKATAYELSMVNGAPNAHVLGSVEYTGTKPDATAARKAFKANGIQVKRGATIESVKVAETVYGMSVEQFMAYAQPVAAGAIEE